MLLLYIKSISYTTTHCAQMKKLFDAIQKLQTWRTGGASMQNDTENRLGGPARDRGFGITRNFDRQFRNWQGDGPVAPACKMIGKINTTRGAGRRNDSP